MTVLENDYFDVDALYASIGSEKLLRDKDFNLFEKGKDYLVPLSYDSEIRLFCDNTQTVLRQKEEIDKYKNDFDMIFDEAMYGQPDRITLTYKAFSDTASKEVTVPAKIIGAKVVLTRFSFGSATSVKKVAIEEGVDSLPENLFSDCTSLEKVIIPMSVTSIGQVLFTPAIENQLTIYCVRAKSEAPTGWQWNWNLVPGSQRFFRTVYSALTVASVDGLTYRLNPDNCTAAITAADSSFADVIPEKITHSLYEEKEYTVTSIEGEIGKASIMEIIVPDSVTHISKSAFAGCSALTKITLPFIGENADGSGATYFGHIFGATSYNGQSSSVPQSLETAVLTNGDIPSYAFFGCAGITDVAFPDDSTSIGSFSFSGCNGFTSITIPDSVTSIGDSAFYGCSGLTSITIPDSVTSIGGHAFNNCYTLTSITFNGTKSQWYAITKATYWDNNTGNYTITCTNGTIRK